MKFAVEVTSREIIKPASPIPDDVGRYQLSFLDQLAPSVFIPLVIFYPNCATESNNSSSQTYSNQLKKSLSQALTVYYPLSGRLKGNDYVDFNNETGVSFLEAQVKCQLSQLIDNPVPDEEMNKLLPFELDQATNDLLLGVQFNVFECGGVVLGLCLSHKVGDGSSLFSFVKFWSATTRGDGQVPRPEFVSAALFPPIDIAGFSPRAGITKENVVTRRFVFPAASVEALRSKLATSVNLKGQPPPTRVETLTVFLWTRFMAATKAEPSPSKVYFIVHAVNLRTRMDPPLLESSFGNFYRAAFTFPYTRVYDGDLVCQVRDSIKRVDKEEVKKLQMGKEYLDYMKKQAESFSRGEMVPLSLTSFCRFPIYEADFGWGKPLWVGAPRFPFSNLVVFTDTASGDGIEALVQLKEDDMSKFQEDEELLQFVLR